MRDVSEIFRAQKHGGLPVTELELNAIRSSLRSNDPELDVHHAARVLALAGPPNNDDLALLIGRLSLSSEDWDLQGIIYALCIYWEKARDHLTFLLQLIEYETWSEFSSASIAAMSALSKYSFGENDAEIFCRIHTCFRDASGALENSPSDFLELYLAQLYRCLDVADRGPKANVDAIAFRFPESADIQRMERWARKCICH